jgi:hypothetical protein
VKQKDLVLIIVVGFVSAVFAVLATNLLMGSADSRKQTAEVVDPIVADFDRLDSRYFNSNSVNPTQLIEIRDQSNNNHLIKQKRTE